MSHSKEDDLKLGSITEVWTSREQWLKYCQYLDNMAAEAYDSEGVPIKLSRYALFLKVSNCKVEKILKGSLDLIPSPSPSVKILIMGKKVCLRCKSKTLLGIVNKLLKTKSLLTSSSNVVPYYLK